MQAQYSVVQCLEVYLVQHQPKPLLEERAVAGRPLPPPVPPLSRHVHNDNLLAPTQQ